MACMRFMPQLNCWVFDDGRVAIPYADTTVRSKREAREKQIHFIKPDVSKLGYSRVTVNGKHYGLHRLVAEAFIPNPESKPTVDHIDRNPRNNDVSNLRWASPKEQADNTRLVDSGLSLYGVRKCENPKEYNHRWHLAHREERIAYHRRRREALKAAQ